ncbi:MAG: site-specific DNA-methyltransferase [Candidatus Poribacteria bacterium]|nr:site-specific DNA-methyltransferase [Candidatus Poribacteria bacterium]
MQESLQKLQELLQQLFRADAADLDFGIYRIINYRRDQLQAFIDKELPTIVQSALDANTETESAREELEDLKKRVKDAFGDDVLDADGNLVDETIRDRPLVKKYLEAREQLGSPQTRDQREDTVYNHLYTFFSRYYDNGDFIPRRRYSQTERYAVPYNGEEIYLHWANRDQYYVKSGEHFSTYRFKSQGITVIFDLRDVDVEKDNVKGVKRFFIPLSEETTYSPETDEICIPFEYRPLTDEEKKRYSGQKQQDKIIDAAEPVIMACLTDHYNALSALDRQTEGETTLKKHLRTYTRRNTADFFIHKNLKQFLNRELDVFIKNEVIPISDFILTNVNSELSRGGGVTAVLTNSNNWLETAKLVHQIAAQIIEFLSHIEEFQKRLWLKKKFVLSTDYCLTLDRIPEEFYSEIVQNNAQLEEWKDLFAIHEIDSNLILADYTEPLSVEFLKENPNLVLDTCHFDLDFKDRLLAHFDDLDNETDGLLIHGENFQALNLLTEKYRELIKSIYIDPPYNTNASAILYKNNYKDSSWMSLMADRITVSRELLADNGILCVAIDDVEAANLRQLLQNLFGKENELAIVAVCSNPGGRKRPTGFAPAHEYAMFFGVTGISEVGRLAWNKKQLEAYNEIDEHGKFGWRSLRKSGGPNTHREASPRLFYPLFVKNDQIRIPKMRWNETSREWEVLETIHQTEKVIWPINANGEEMTWGYGTETLKDKLALSELSATTDTNGNIRIRFKRYLNEEGTLPTTWWNNKEYSATAQGTRFLTNILGNALAFLFPKSIYLLEDCLRASSLGKNDAVLDYFGGSGTTAHATINLNREDEGNRKYILVEMGHHFDTVLIPRIKKVVYAEKWKDAKPVSRDSRLSHIIKYQGIESYEDSVNNIEFTEHENILFDEHQLNYLLGSETRESPTLLNINNLQNPFNYQLNIVKDMQTQKQSVDLPETFNYLLGLSVQTLRCLYDDDRRYLIYKGKVGQKPVVVIWRETEGWGEQDWKRDHDFIEEQKLTEGADKVYVNTDSIVPEAESLDPLFKRLMFSQ